MNIDKVFNEFLEKMKQQEMVLNYVQVRQHGETILDWGRLSQKTRLKDVYKRQAYISEKYNCAVLCKGGHSINDANDLLYSNGTYHWFYGKRIDNPNTHGTGCTLSSAIASNLAKGRDLNESVEKAKAYISGALSAMLDLGKGSGPMNHAFAIKGEY